MRDDVRQGWVVGLLAVVAGVIAFGVAAILLVTSDDDTLVLDLDAGDCFDVSGDLSDGRIQTVDTTDCSDPHEAEVFASGRLNPDRDQPYPSDAQLFARVDHECGAVLGERPDVAERFGVLPVIPDEASWEPYEGRYVCVAIPYGGGTTEGTLGF